MLTMLFRSWAERFDDANEIDSILSKLADKDRQYWWFYKQWICVIFIVYYRLRQQKWPIIFTGFWGIYTDLWTLAHILFDFPWSHDSKMGWTISVGQNKLELDQFLARKFIMEIIEIENIFICP